MIQQIKQRMKNEKGLTLVELLAVLVILGIIAAIAVPAVGNILQKSKEDAVKSEAIQVINAAKLYVAAEGIDGDATLGTTDGNNQLIPYLEEVTDQTKKFTVNVSLDSGKVVYRITSTDAIEAGKITIKFNGATVDEINKAERGKTTIGSEKSSDENSQG